ncbi:hypothetical protein J7M07_03860 [bacterium]|nr:hypothetical protein [bacterium]
MIDLEELKEVISSWKEAVEWIAHGWDCIEEYTHGLSYREDLQDLLDQIQPGEMIPTDIKEEIAKMDSKFISDTENSDLCVWDCEAKFCYLDENNIELLPINEYDKDKYWYYYRWQPDCLYPWKNNGAESFQKEVYGLDFAGMTNDQLIEAVKDLVALCKDQLE